jgi:hypothetical protein
MGKEIADSGNVIINKDIQVVLFDQEIDFDSNLTVDEFMMTLDSAPIMALKIIINPFILQTMISSKKLWLKWKFIKHGILKMK